MWKNTADIQMLKLVEHLKQTGTIKFNKQFVDAIEMQKQSFTQIEKGNRSFTVSQIQKACEVYNLNANWVFGFEKEMFRVDKSSKSSTD